MIIKFFKGVKYAAKGIIIGILYERNFRIDISIMLYVLFFSQFYSLSSIQKVILVLICFNVPAFELMNTAVERAVDNPDSAHYEKAGQAKDTAAGAVLLSAIGAAVAGILMFWDTAVFKEIFIFLFSNYVNFACFILSLIVAYLFINYDVFIKKFKG